MVELFSWNPKLPLIPRKLGGKAFPLLTRRANNFGDVLGPALTLRILEALGVDTSAGSASTRLLTIGSVLHFAKDGDTVWGSGRNGKIDDSAHQFSRLDVRAVRGPLSAEFLRERGIEVPAVYGDPGLLTSLLFPELRPGSESAMVPLTISPNFNDYGTIRDKRNVLNPRSPLIRCLARLAKSRLVVGSSLHGIIVAESFGVQARLVAPRHESAFKYRDYYLGTGREVPETAPDVATAIRMGGAPLPEFDPSPLMNAFPVDLWKRDDDSHR